MRDSVITDGINVDGALDSVVAWIKARGAGCRLPGPSPEGVAAFQDHAGQERPMSGAELDEHERMWRAVDVEIEVLIPVPIGNSGPASQR